MGIAGTLRYWLTRQWRRRKVVRLEGPLEKIGERWLLRIPLGAGGDVLAATTQGIAQIKDGFLEIELPDQLVQNLKLKEGQRLLVHNATGEFTFEWPPEEAPITDGPVRQSVAAMTDGPLTALETAVLAETCKQLPAEDRAAFEQQIEGISVERRENTGAGFYTYFNLKPTSAAPIRTDTKGCHVAATINGLQDALGFILWTENGYVQYLEGYTMTLDSTVGMNLSELDFELTSAPPIGSSSTRP